MESQLSEGVMEYIDGIGQVAIISVLCNYSIIFILLTIVFNVSMYNQDICNLRPFCFGG